jgi:hypothetical protein
VAGLEGRGDKVLTGNDNVIITYRPNLALLGGVSK